MNLEWIYKRAYWKIRKYMDTHWGLHINKKNYYQIPILSLQETNRCLEELIVSGRPFAAGRIGGSELKAMIQCQPEVTDPKKKADAQNLLFCLSGFFGDVSDLEKFTRLMESSLAEMDLIGVWFNQMEDYMIHRYAKKTVMCGKLEGLEPWYNPGEPWTRALKGKKVLCIHPFKDSILSQYEKREQLFVGSDILPEFELFCIKAVQTLLSQEDERFSSWFDALEYMYDEAMKIDFDIALIACGAYGFPLAAKIKQAGKQAIHMGGAMQLLFGIRGKRWDDFELLQPFYNDAWVRPLESEKLKNGGADVEQGCYW